MKKNDNFNPSDTSSSYYDMCLKLYTKKLFNKITISPSCLSTTEIYDLCTCLIKEIISRSANGKTPFLQAVSIRVFKMSKIINDEDRLLVKYYQKVTPDEKIVDYLCEKYAYLLEEYKNLGCYDELVNQFKNIVSDTIISLGLIKSDIEANLRVKLFKKAREIRWDDEYVIDDLKKNFHDRFEGKINDHFLDELIMFYINEYEEAYLNGTSKICLREYLLTRVPDALRRYVLKVQKINEEIETINFINVPNSVKEGWINNYAINHSVTVNGVKEYMFKQILNYSSDDYDKIDEFKEKSKLKTLNNKK